MNNVHPVFVTGPQRSGTTIIARILADKLNKTYLDESEYNPVDIPDNAIIQAPFISKFILELSFKFPLAFFIIVIRDKQEIVKSMERIEWYKDHINNPEFYSTYVDTTYDIIDLQLKQLPESRYLKINYDSLKSHNLFVDDRKDFTTRQWQKDKAKGPAKWRNDDHTRSYALRLQDLPTSTVGSA